MNIETGRDAISIYCCRYDRIDEPWLLDQYYNLLSRTEQQRWQGIRTKGGKQCFLVSRAMIRTLLATAIGCPPTALTLAANAQGKPFVDHPTTRWQFNLSHSHGLITLALVYDTDVGIDVERHRHNIETLQLARHFFHPREYQQLEALPASQQQPHFFKLWTLKEAYVKAIGCGLAYAFNNFGFTFHSPGSEIIMHPSPPSTINCWLMQPELNYTLASITLSQSPEIRPLKLHDYLPYHHCTPRQPHSLAHRVIAAPSAHSQCI
ncbi:MAG: 4'-phosphopantetheinyl transferase superfamily protein [Gammaproteobacteria bacterium]|nr:4'-phosphopantetheinyl transferase superfamily protein [Gammaproteobacteria bacterium]MCF6362449.1 4'-phosphopantetheinyl transferase superfamily protein [Gammaproteobacteria bacterium]